MALTPKQLIEHYNQFYVYELIDPRDNKVFYVGKGKNNRVHEHTKKVMRNSAWASNDSKNKIIKEILDLGLKPLEEIVERFETDEEAVEFEAELIGFYGIENLTNKQSKGSIYIHYDKDTKGLAEAKSAMKKIAKMYAYFVNPNKNNNFSIVDGEVIDAYYCLKQINIIFDELIHGKFRQQLIGVLDKEIETKHFGASRLI